MQNLGWEPLKQVRAHRPTYRASSRYGRMNNWICQKTCKRRILKTWFRSWQVMVEPMVFMQQNHHASTRTKVRKTLTKTKRCRIVFLFQYILLCKHDVKFKSIALFSLFTCIVVCVFCAPKFFFCRCRNNRISFSLLVSAFFLTLDCSCNACSWRFKLTSMLTAKRKLNFQNIGLISLNWALCPHFVFLITWLWYCSVGSARLVMERLLV